MRRAKKKGAGPSPASYRKEDYREHRVPGSYKQKGDIISFAAEAANLLGETPLVKYDHIEMDKLKKKPRYTTIETKIDRFKPTEKNASPSPSSYDT